MPDSQQRRLAAILAADIAGYSALMGADEDATVRDLKGHQAVVLPMIAAHGGRVIDTAGDGILAEFPSVLNAVKCSVAIQRVMAERNAVIEPSRRMQFRIGVNLGDIIFDDARIYGDGINIAARLENIAEAGGICISGKVYQEIRGRLDVAVQGLGMQTLKNIAEPVRVYRIKTDSISRVTIASQRTAQLPAITLPDKPSIAVLPFTNMSGDPDSQFFGDGVAEDVLTELSKLRWLFVIARNSSFTYREKTIDIQQVARELGVRYVLEGSIRRSAKRVRLSAQLIEASVGSHVWADKYDRDLADIFGIQDEITCSVSAAIAPAIVLAERQRAVRKPPESLGSWEAYQRGMWHMSKHTSDDNETARLFFQKAIEFDPTFAAAYGGLSATFTLGSSVFRTMSVEKGIELAEPLVRRGVSLDEGDADLRGRLALLIYNKGDHQGAIHEADHALLITPNCAIAHGAKGAALVYSGRLEEGREELQQYLRLDPLDPGRAVRLYNLAVSYYLDRDYETSAQVARKVIRQFPGNPPAYRILTASLGQLGQDSEIKELVQTIQGTMPQLMHSMYPVGRYWRTADRDHFLEGLNKAGFFA